MNTCASGDTEFACFENTSILSNDESMPVSITLEGSTEISHQPVPKVDERPDIAVNRISLSTMAINAGPADAVSGVRRSRDISVQLESDEPNGP